MCDFCDKNILDVQKVIENNQFILIYPKKPIIENHLIIITRAHISDLVDLENNDWLGFSEMFNLVLMYYKGLKIDGYNLFVNVGKKAGQSVAHIHWHVLPRFDHELVSPFEKINQPKKYQIEPIDRDKMIKEVESIRLFFRDLKF